MKDRRFKPMMMTASMRAYIRRLKTMTRRLLNPQPEHAAAMTRGPDGKWYRWLDNGKHLDPHNIPSWAPPYSPGDLLWIKEPWASVAANNICHPGDDYIVYRATDPDWSEYEGWKWKSAMFMPKAACRHIAEVTEVHSPEQVQEISERDAECEGCRSDNAYTFEHEPMGHVATAAERFHDLWDSIHKKPERRWDANPWVWPIVFRPFEGDELAEALRELTAA